MKKVSYSDVEGYFHIIWPDGAESFFHEVLWDALDEIGLTSYVNDKEYALCHAYAFVLQMLCDEYSDMVDECKYYYDIELPYEEPLTEAAVGWLYRDVLNQVNANNTDDCFDTDASKMFPRLIINLRRSVSEPLFNHLGVDLLTKLFFFSRRGCPLETDEYYENDSEPEKFRTKEEYLKYCQECPFNVLWDLPEYIAFLVMSWMDAHSDHV